MDAVKQQLGLVGYGETGSTVASGLQMTRLATVAAFTGASPAAPTPASSMTVEGQRHFGGFNHELTDAAGLMVTVTPACLRS